jgi:hypothetical protein
MISAGNSQPKNNGLRMKLNVNAVSPPILDENKYVFQAVKKF